MDSHAIWLTVGFLGQAMFSMRFLIQWLKSEKKGRSVIPIEFWYLSIAGGLILLIYAIHTADPVFIFGQAGGLLIYARNLHLIQRVKGKQPAVDSVPPEP
ncbi:MAG: lipid A biosynthesis protein [Candidatus Manganitrophaceae bacterium]|nr:MAG: lipid A biosynthesis protein [Candidatus Manganitrophaceae bacterium]